MHYYDVITNPRWRTDAILKIIFWLYLGDILADQREIWNTDEASHKRSVHERMCTLAGDKAERSDSGVGRCQGHHAGTRRTDTQTGRQTETATCRQTDRQTAQQTEYEGGDR